MLLASGQGRSFEGPCRLASTRARKGFLSGASHKAGGGWRTPQNKQIKQMAMAPSVAPVRQGVGGTQESGACVHQSLGVRLAQGQG